jgi:hypothetical protein
LFVPQRCTGAARAAPFFFLRLPLPDLFPAWKCNMKRNLTVAYCEALS